MPWAVAAPIAGAVVSSAISSNGGGTQTNGGAGTTTNTKEPWLQAQPWIMGNMISGQNLQNQYTAQPFNQQQVNAYQNLGNQTSYINQVVPSLLGQISSQKVGFDPSNPTAMPTAYNFNGVGSGSPTILGASGSSGSSTSGTTGGGGLLAQLANPQSSATSAVMNPLPAAPAPAPAPATPKFVNQGNYDPASIALVQNGKVPTGSYGSFTYGMAMPTPGTQAYADMNAYLAYGGNDPLHLYSGGALGSGGGGGFNQNSVGGSSANYQ